MEKKLNIADFATLVGTTPKTIYDKINNYGELPENEQLKTVIEKVKGRSIKVILTNDTQIEYYKSLYGKSIDNNREYYETLTGSNGNKPVNEVRESVKSSSEAELPNDLIDKLITINNVFNDRLEQKNTELMNVQKELFTVQGRQLLLEDKASREGYYINEINKSVQLITRYKRLLTITITVIIMLLMVILGFITYQIGVKNSSLTPPSIGNSIMDEVEK